jgi:hypothetical protein
VTEPDVALTDFALALECAILAGWIAHSPGITASRGAWIAFYVATGAAAALGGIWHGFFTAPGRVSAALWVATLLAVGAAAVAAWVIGACAILAPAAARAVIAAAAAVAAAYALVVIGQRGGPFALAVAAYLPATLWLLVAFAQAWRARPTRALGLGLAGVLATLGAVVVQRTGANALYHVVQGIALALIAIGARALPGRPGA